MFRHKTQIAERLAFSLVELLVVVAIIALLISILLPALSRAKYQSRLTVCMSHLKQVGTGISTFAYGEGVIPHGPDVKVWPDPTNPMLEANDGNLATNQIWTGPQEPIMHLMAHGLLITKELTYPNIMYCPGDDTNDPVEELDKVAKKKVAPAFSSYIYRQLDETNGTGKIENLGKNSVGNRAVALAMDINSLISIVPNYGRTNHNALKVNVLYLDMSVQSLRNKQNIFSLRDEDFPINLVKRRAEIFQNADTKY